LEWIDHLEIEGRPGPVEASPDNDAPRPSEAPQATDLVAGSPSEAPQATDLVAGSPLDQFATMGYAIDNCMENQI
jgi:hypothetical protein